VAQITKLKAQKNQKRVNLFVDGKFVCGLSLDLVVNRGLAAGEEISQSDLADLINEALFEKFYARSLSFLSYRPRSTFELERYLNKKADSKNFQVKKVLTRIIKKLAQKGLLDDQKFALWWVKQRLEFRPKGKLALKKELYKKGVDKNIIDQVLSKFDEKQILKKFYQKKLKKKPLLLKNKQKLIAYLKRRGFLWRSIKPLVDEINNKA